MNLHDLLASLQLEVTSWQWKSLPFILINIQVLIEKYNILPVLLNFFSDYFVITGLLLPIFALSLSLMSCFPAIAQVGTKCYFSEWINK